MKDTKANNKQLASICFYAKNSARGLVIKTQKTACVRNGRERAIEIIM